MSRTSYNDWNFMGDSLDAVKSHRQRPYNAAVVSFLFLFSALLLVLFGLVSVYSATIGLDSGDSPITFFIRQILFCTAGIACGAVLVALPYSLLRNSSPVLTLGAILYFGYLVLQQPAKKLNETDVLLIFVVTAVYFSSFFANRNNKVQGIRDLITPLIVVVSMAVVLTLDGDIVICILYVLFAIALFVFGGVGFAGTVIMFLFVLIPVVSLVFSSPDRINELLDYIVPGFSDNYRSAQAVIRRQCIVSGSFLGKGIAMGVYKFEGFNGIYTQNILCNIFEECGLIGFLVYVAVSVFCWVTAYSGASKLKDDDLFRSNLIYCITTLFVFQTIVNTASVFGYFPSSEISLPFISYGWQNIVIIAGASLVYKCLLKDNAARRKGGKLILAQNYESETN